MTQTGSELPVTAWVAIIGVLVTVLVQFGGIIWFAATQRTMLNALTAAVNNLEEALKAIDAMASALNTRVSILEDRAGNLRRRSGDSPL